MFNVNYLRPNDAGAHDTVPGPCICVCHANTCLHAPFQRMRAHPCPWHMRALHSSFSGSSPCEDTKWSTGEVPLAIDCTKRRTTEVSGSTSEGAGSPSASSVFWGSLV